MIFQQLLPNRSLATIFFKIANCEIRWVKHILIKFYIYIYKPNMVEAEFADISSYENLNQFFIRRLKPDCRHINYGTDIIVAPVDGNIDQIGKISGDYFFQAKNITYSLDSILAGNSALSVRYQDGHFATLFLSPADYHRIHMPVDGKLLKMIFVPGKTNSVQPISVKTTGNLYAKNEHLIFCLNPQT